MHQLVMPEVERVLAGARLPDGIARLSDLPDGLRADIATDLACRASEELAHLFAAEFHQRRSGESPAGSRKADGLWSQMATVVEDHGVAAFLGDGYRAGQVRVRRILERRCSFLLSAYADLLRDTATLVSAGWLRCPDETTRLTDMGGDTHGGQQSVLTFSIRGSRIVYKPRSLAADALAFELLSVIDSESDEPLFRTPALMEFGDHGWVEYVSHLPLQYEDERVSYLVNVGHLLGAAWVLCLTDLHAENLISVGSWPVIIDAETLLQPALRTASDRTIGGNDDSFSVLDVHLLPDVEGTEGRRWDSSGIGGTPQAVTDAQEPVVVAAGRDDFTVRWRDRRLPDYAIHPDVLHDPIGDAAHLRSGFERSVELALRARSRIEGILANAAAGGLRRRVILRSTGAYQRALLRVRSPRFAGSSNALRRELHLGVPPLADGRRATREQVVELEQRVLFEGDVPRFETTLGASDLRSDDACAMGVVVPRNPLFAHADQRFAQEGAIIEASLLCRDAALRAAASPDGPLLDTSPSLKGSSLPLRSRRSARSDSATRHRIVYEEVERLRRHGLLPDDPTGPLYGLMIEPRFGIRRLPSDLHRGALGVAVFLAAIARSHESVWAQGIVEQSLTRMRSGFAHDLFGRPGILDGAGGALLGLDLLERTRPGTVPDEVVRRLRETAVEELVNATAAPGSASNADLATGIAGTLLSLTMHASEQATVDAMEAAVKCLLGRQTDEGAWLTPGGMQLCGAAHGSAGVAMALARSAGVVSEELTEQIVHACTSALQFERRSWDNRRARWTDHRLTRSQQEEALNGWCHGAAGILLSRLVLSEAPGMSWTEISDDIQLALRSLENHRPRTDRLCCGRAGVIDALLMLQRHPRAERLLDPVARLHLDDFLEQSLGELQERFTERSLVLEPVAGDHGLQHLLPGLFRGVGGPLYIILRSLDPSLPPVLPGGVAVLDHRSKPDG